jgi:hypothetical protein
MRRKEKEKKKKEKKELTIWLLAKYKDNKEVCGWQNRDKIKVREVTNCVPKEGKNGGRQ